MLQQFLREYSFEALLELQLIPGQRSSVHVNAVCLPSLQAVCILLYTIFQSGENQEEKEKDKATEGTRATFLETEMLRKFLTKLPFLFLNTNYFLGSGNWSFPVLIVLIGWT